MESEESEMLVTHVVQNIPDYEAYARQMKQALRHRRRGEEDQLNYLTARLPTLSRDPDKPYFEPLQAITARLQNTDAKIEQLTDLLTWLELIDPAGERVARLLPILTQMHDAMNQAAHLHKRRRLSL
jgi:hypothetical protein